MDKNGKIYIAGHLGMVGSAIHRKLKSEGFNNFIFKSFEELDLRNQNDINNFFSKEKPDYVILAAAKVGGIHANNTQKAEFIYDNVMIEANIIHASYINKVKKLLFLGSSCIYPKMAPQPIKEEYLLTGPLEATNDAYALAKITGIKLCETYRQQYGCNFISVMPTNLYGTNDNYDLMGSHVIPALIRKFVEAKQKNAAFAEVWGSGNPKREFLHVDDLAEACYFLMLNYNEPTPINIGCGIDVSIKELSEIIANISEFKGTIKYNTSMPDGTPRKLLDVSKINKLGWKYKIDLETGLEKTIEEFKQKFNIK
ncbi:MAG: GDP-fucose synthetase [Bacteroidetes bacterium CG2_30_32_10]|nr:MAG: GDP-fucose synthetase [Bacteroidetes bacterium CG2_30_32_10]